jgi:hypothetical protein
MTTRLLSSSFLFLSNNKFWNETFTVIIIPIWSCILSSSSSEVLPASNLQPAPAKKVRKVKNVLYRCYLYNCITLTSGTWWAPALALSSSTSWENSKSNFQMSKMQPNWLYPMTCCMCFFWCYLQNYFKVHGHLVSPSSWNSSGTEPRLARCLHPLFKSPSTSSCKRRLSPTWIDYF